jgi:hypothetical protein
MGDKCSIECKYDNESGVKCRVKDGKREYDDADEAASRMLLGSAAGNPPLMVAMSAVSNVSDREEGVSDEMRG